MKEMSKRHDMYSIIFLDTLVIKLTDILPKEIKLMCILLLTKIQGKPYTFKNYLK